MVCTLNGQCSGICGGASFWEERLTLAERGKIDDFKINDDVDDDSMPVVPNLWPRGQKWPARPQKVALDLLKNF